MYTSIKWFKVEESGYVLRRVCTRFRQEGKADSSVKISGEREGKLYRKIFPDARAGYLPFYVHRRRMEIAGSEIQVNAFHQGAVAKIQ
jgi:hypothetical protein